MNPFLILFLSSMVAYATKHPVVGTVLLAVSFLSFLGAIIE